MLGVPGPPNCAAQRALLVDLARRLEPLRVRHRLPPYTLVPGLRLRSLWGRCRHFPDGRPPEIAVRCTHADDRSRWRQASAIAGTLLHEMAHLRHAGHGPRFWSLHRALVDGAAAMGVYDPRHADPSEAGRGAEKLAGTAADALARAARARRQARAATNREAARRWLVGDEAQVDLARGALAGRRVQVLAIARGWLTVQVIDTAARYRVAAAVLKPVASER